jgi:hypothetical protein
VRIVVCKNEASFDTTNRRQENVFLRCFINISIPIFKMFLNFKFAFKLHDIRFLLVLCCRTFFYVAPAAPTPEPNLLYGIICCIFVMNEFSIPGAVGIGGGAALLFWLWVHKNY